MRHLNYRSFTLSPSITGADPGGGGFGGRDPPPPLLSITNFFFSTNFLSICGLRHTGNVQGGGVLVNVQEWVYFSIFRRADDVTRTMSKGGCLIVNVQEWGYLLFFLEGG